eukprot:m51a1_g10824 hypothetical protein (139) ;mRNA; r:6962-15075
MASKLSLVLVLAAAALASATLTVTVNPARRSLNTYTAHGAFLTVRVNNWEEHISGMEIHCHAYYAYLDYFGQPWTHPVDEQIMNCNSGRTGNCNMWLEQIAAPANNNTVIEAVAYCQHNNGPKIWAEGAGNVRFQHAL